MTNPPEEHKGMDLFIVLFILPIVLVAILFSIIAVIAARRGASYNVVKLISAPAWLMISNFMGIVLFIPLAFALAVVGIEGPMAYAGQNIADLTMYPIWARIVGTFWNFGITDYSLTIPLWHVVAYQAALYIIIGSRAARAVTTAILESAICSIADSKGVQPYSVRQEYLQTDAGYAKAERFFIKVDCRSVAAAAAIGLLGVRPSQFY